MVIGLVLAFRSSSNLAVAYGISVSATMLIDTLLLALVARSLWPKARARLLPLCVVFFIIDLGFVIANGAKLLQGARFPVVLGIFLFTMMRTGAGAASCCAMRSARTASARIPSCRA